MLSVKNRLKINKAQSYRWKNKKQIYTPFFRFIYRFNSNSLDPKIGFIVPGKIKGAVVRNRARRYLIESIRTRIDKFPKTLEAVLIADQKIADANYEEINNWIDNLLSKISFTTNQADKSSR